MFINCKFPVTVVEFEIKFALLSFLPRDAMRKCGLCRRTVSVRPFVCHVRVF